MERDYLLAKEPEMSQDNQFRGCARRVVHAIQPGLLKGSNDCLRDRILEVVAVGIKLTVEVCRDKCSPREAEAGAYEWGATDAEITAELTKRITEGRDNTGRGVAFRRK